MPERRYYRCKTCKRPVVMSGVHWAHRYGKDAAACLAPRPWDRKGSRLEVEEYNPKTSDDRRGTERSEG